MLHWPGLKSNASTKPLFKVRRKIKVALLYSSCVATAVHQNLQILNTSNVQRANSASTVPQIVREWTGVRAIKTNARHFPEKPNDCIIAAI